MRPKTLKVSELFSIFVITTLCTQQLLQSQNKVFDHSFFIQEVDLAAADLTVHYGRAQVMDYVFPAINIEDVDVIYRKKTAPASPLFLLVNSLQPAIYLIFFGVVSGVLVMFIIVENQQICEGESTILLRQLSSISWQFIGSVFRQGQYGS